MSDPTMIDIAGEAIEAACQLEQCPPTAITVLWAFSFSSAMAMFREGYAKRSGPDEWAMQKAAIDQIWPEVERGLELYLRSCSDVGIAYVLPTKEEFFGEVVPGALGILSDVRLVRKQDLDVLAVVLAERYGADFLALEASEKRLMIYVAKKLFNTLGLVDPGP